MKILIADDDERVRLIVGQILKAGGYEVETAGDGVAAFEKALASPPDMIISDILMPGMSGYELCRRVRGDARLRDIPFIFCTAGFLDKNNRELAKKLGASLYLLKPVGGDRFLKEIAETFKECKEKVPAPELTRAEVEKLEQTLLRDISVGIEDKAIELQRNGVRYTRLVESSNEAVFFYTRDREGHFTYISPTVLGITGYTPQELAGEYAGHLAKSLPNNDFSRWSQPGAEKLQAAKEGVIKHRDGRARFLRIYEMPVLNEAGEVLEIDALVTDITRQRQQEETLWESEHNFRELMDNTPDLIFSLDREERHIAVNRAVCETLGLKAAEIIGKNLAEVGFPEAVVKEWKQLDRRALDGENVKAETETALPDGSVRVLEAFLQPMRNNAGAVIGVRGTSRDITERRRQEAALRASEQNLRELLDNTPDFIYSLDREGRHTAVNRAVCEALGLKAAEIIGKNHTELGFPEAVVKEWKQMHRRVLDGENVKVETETTMPDGSVHAYEVFLQPMRNSDGAVNGIRGTSRDITERRRQDAAIRESEQRFQESFENAGVGKCITGPNGCFLASNKALCDMLGYEAPELLRHNFSEFTHPEDIEKSREFVKDALAGNITKFSLEKRYVNKAGGVIYAKVSALLFRDKAGRPIYFITEIQDITAQHRAEEEKARLQAQFLQAQKMEAVGRLAGGVAHDFNNILTSIFTCSDFLLKSVAPGDPRIEDMEEIKKSAGRAAALTRQLLAFSRKQVLQVKTMGLNEVVSDIGKLVRRVIGENIDLKIAPDPEAGYVKADPCQIEQIIINLAVNARDAMPEGGKLTIETANVELSEDYTKTHEEIQPGQYVMLAVSDTGCGMEPSVLASIFEPFFTTKEKGKGTGLGLATVYGIVKQSGGSIFVYSEPGHGTSFKIYLPRVNAAAEALPEARPAQITARGTETILVVEDDDALGRLACRNLSGNGYNALRAATPQEALEICKKQDCRLALMITDVVMPGMNGQELAKLVKALRPGIRIIFMSGYPANIITSNGVLDAGIAFLEKPFTPDAMLNKVRQVLGPPVAAQG